MGYRPSRLDPLWNEEKKKWRMRAKEKANFLGQFFEAKMTQDANGRKIGKDEANRQMRRKFKVGRMELSPQISEEEVYLATRDLPRNKAPGPDRFPNEIYKNCSACHKSMAELYSSMI